MPRARSMRQKVRDYMRTMKKQNDDVQTRALWIAEQVMARDPVREKGLLLVAEMTRTIDGLLDHLIAGW